MSDNIFNPNISIGSLFYGAFSDVGLGHVDAVT
jgi:hypothetical protein